MELVKPDGVVTNVTQDSDPELFFALKVRFRIVWWGFVLTALHLGHSEQFRAYTVAYASWGSE